MALRSNWLNSLDVAKYAAVMSSEVYMVVIGLGLSQKKIFCVCVGGGGGGGQQFRILKGQYTYLNKTFIDNGCRCFFVF